MNNLPSNLKRHTMFRDKPYTHTLVFDVGYPMPAVNDISGQVRRGKKIIQAITPTFTVDGQRLTFTYQAADLAKIEGLSEQYILFNNDAIFGGQINVIIGYGDPESTESQVIIEGGSVTVIEMPGLSLVSDQVVIATGAAASSLASSQTATQQATISTTKAGESSSASAISVSAKDAAVAARDETSAAKDATLAAKSIVDAQTAIATTKATEASNSALAAVAAYKGPWTASTAYAEGNQVTNGGNTYRRKSTGVSGLTFDASQWDIVAQGGSVSDGSVTYAKLDTATKAIVDTPSVLQWSGSPILFDFTARTVTITNGRWHQRKDYISPLLNKNSGSGAEVAIIPMVAAGSASGLNFLYAHLPTKTYYCVTLATLSTVPADAILLFNWADAAGLKLSYPYARTEVDDKVTTVNTRISTQEKSKVFQGELIESYLNTFLLDIQFFNLTILPTDQIYVYYAWRGVSISSTNRWILAIAVNSTRICQFEKDAYIEPTPDANGNIIENIDLPAYLGSGITARAKVNWSQIALTLGKNYLFASDRPKSLLSPRNTFQALPPQDFGKLTVNDLFLTSGVDDWIYKFILDIKFAGNPISIPTGAIIHLVNVWRAGTNLGLTQWIVDIGINDTRFTQFKADFYTEPTADANGNIFDTISFAELLGSGITATARVNWAALPLAMKYAFTGSAVNRLKAAFAPAAYNRTLAGFTSSRLTLTPATVPDRVYTVLNDVDSRNIVPVSAGPLRQDMVRQYSPFIYLDHFLIGINPDTDIRFDETGTDKLHITSPRKNDKDISTDHPTPSTVIAKSVKISGGSKYYDKTVSFNQISVRESTGADSQVIALFCGDSTIEDLQKEVGVPEGYAHAIWGVIHEQFQKCRIDYLLEQGYTASQIQSDSISPTHDKYRYIGIGTVEGHSPDTYTINYRGVTKTYTVRAEGRGSWSYYMYINKPRLFQRSQGLWDAIGCGNGTGTDYTGTAAQVYQIDRTAWTPTAAVDTAAMRAWALSIVSFTGTTLADYIARFQQIELDPVNPFYDKDSTRTVTDSSGQVWQIKYSIAAYVSRWRTMDNSGVRLVSGNGSIGSKVGANLNNFDVTRPTHVVMQSCQNDGNYAHFGKMCKAFADSVKAEYTTNGWGTVNIGLSIIDGAGTYFPKLYPEIDSFCALDPNQRSVHNDNLARLLTEVTAPDTNRIWPICNTHIIPTAKSVIYRSANSPEYELTGDERDTFAMPSRTSTGIKAHINAVGYRNVGIHMYNWIKYTLGL